MYRQWEHVSMSMLAFSSKHQLLPNAHGLTEQRGCLYTLNPVKIIETRIAQMKLWKTVVALCTENTQGESQKNPGIEWQMWEVWANKWLHSGLRLAGTLKCSIFFRTRRITCLHLRSENGVALSLIHRGETECYTLSTLGWGGGVWRGEADKSSVEQRCSCRLCLFVFISGATAVHESAPAQQTVNEHCNWLRPCESHSRSQTHFNTPL